MSCNQFTASWQAVVQPVGPTGASAHLKITSVCQTHRLRREPPRQVTSAPADSICHPLERCCLSGTRTVTHQFMSGMLSEVCPVHLQEQTAGGGSPEQTEARERRALERRARADLDMQRDAEEQPETRWPYISRRGRVSCHTCAGRHLTALPADASQRRWSCFP